MSIFYNGKILDQLSFDSDTSTFIIGNEDISDSFSVAYIPNKEEKELALDQYEVFILENISLNAENDIFLANEIDLDKGIGWVFPLSTLESNDNDYAEKEFFNQFRYLAYQKLLSSSFFLEKEINEKKQRFMLSDLFEDDLIIFAVSLEALGSSFDIYDYLPSLANHGYFLKNEHNLRYKCPNDIIVNWYRGKKKINIRKGTNPVYKTDYSKKLYTNYLKSLDHHLIRFHLIYQIIENHLTDLFNSEFEKILEDYSNALVTKNNFIESINKVRNERENIRKVLREIKPNDGTFEKSMLIGLKRDCREFLNQYGVDERTDVGDLLYDIRNILVHNYREVKDGELILLNDIIFEFEIMINYLMIKSP
ncbi:hypothetical protein B4Q04_21920 [Zobellia sp. OII3]|uniref:hypothetical protein n=1 Tax=Zobellia sp. OII3 TaxID=2034520 RepID=UPI000B530A36|nr:hypothetical protein [Zobellia sp. OII3]OWW23176.1 hypothetical protein B4Q04_21920 [Zobellia sp. OII3]